MFDATLHDVAETLWPRRGPHDCSSSLPNPPRPCSTLGEVHVQERVVLVDNMGRWLWRPSALANPIHRTHPGLVDHGGQQEAWLHHCPQMHYPSRE